MTALRNAHAAGDTAAATRLAAMAKSAKASTIMAERSVAQGGVAGAVARAEPLNAMAMEAMQPKPSMIEDIAKAAGAGLVRGAAGVVGLPGTLSDLMDLPAKKLGLLREDAPGNILSGASLTNALGNVTGGATDYQGQTTAGEYAGTVGEFIPGALMGGGGMVKNALQYGVVPGLASEAAGQLTEGTAAEPWARTIAALAAPVAAGALAKGARAVVSPYGGADPERLKLAKVLDDFGITITAGQRTGAEGLRRAEGSTGAGQELMAQQADDFTKAALKTIGTDATRATPEVLAESANRIGKVFDDVLSGVDVTPDAKALTDFSDALATYRQLAPKSVEVPLLANINKEMVRSFRSGTPIPATTMATWRSSLSKLTTSADTAIREAAIAALDAVDNSMTSTLTAMGRVDDVARLAEARGQWRNFLAIQKAASRAGEERALGVISPSALRNEIALQGRTAYAQGRRGDIGDLARAGEAVMKPLPTVAAGGVRNVPGVSSLISGAAGSAIGGPMGAVAGMMAPSLYAAARMTKPMQAYLQNQLVQPGGPILSPQIARTIPGLLAQ
jgi:hypothetical protein